MKLCSAWKLANVHAKIPAKWNWPAVVPHGGPFLMRRIGMQVAPSNV
jgi:hypothetical protein